MDISEEKIAERAHRLWMEAGSPNGRDEEFWHQAKEMLTQERQNSPADESQRKVDEFVEHTFPASDPVNHM